MTSSFWQERIERCPAMRPWLLRVARRATAGEAMPATLTLGDVPDDKAVRRALEELFPACREENGRLKVRLGNELRDPALWRPLADLLGVKPDPQPSLDAPEARLSKALQRLKILFPNESALIAALAGTEPLLRFFRDRPSAGDDLVALVEATAFLRATPAGVTLSELGAKFFNDSKALRGGPLRAQLEHVLRTQAGGEGEASALFSACGIIENPYTTHAVLFAPIAYRAPDGAWLDWPHRLWQRGEAAILSWKTVRALTAIRFEAPCPLLVTSENAAPFHRLVETRRAALYTEGYPNAAVKALLRLFAQAGATCRHWGDTDLDGYRIAEQVARCIPTSLASCATPGHPLRLTHDQRSRLTRFIDSHPSFPYLAELRQTLARGWQEQEQAIEAIDAILPSA